MEHKTITEFQLVDINRLVPYINNARTHSPEQINKLRASLREFGFVNPIIVDRDYNVLAGHGRLIGAKAEGYKEVPCVFVDEMTEAQKKAYIIADNRMAMDAGWDEELLRVEIESLQGMDFDPLLTGFDEKELADLFGTLSFTVLPRMRTGQTPRSGRRQTPLSVSRWALIRSKRPVNPPSRILARRTLSGSSG